MYEDYNSSANEFVPGGGTNSPRNSGFYTKNVGSPGGGTNSPRKRARNQPLIPTTILQLHTAQQLSPEDDDFIIDHQSSSQVSIVGLILSVTPQATNLNYVVDDGTGQIDVRIWVDQSEPNDFLQQKSVDWVEGRYVRVVGNLRAFGTKRSLVAFRLIVVEDSNEITYHFLESIYAHIQNTQPDLQSMSIPVQQPPRQQQQIQHQHQQIQHQQQQQQQQLHRPGDKKQQLNTLHTQPAPSNDAFKPLQSAILNTIAKAHAATGMGIEEVCQRLSNMASPMEIKKEVGFLTDEGHLYTTSDDQHYALTGDDFV